MEETKSSGSNKDDENHAVGYTGWCESDAEERLFQLLKTEFLFVFFNKQQHRFTHEPVFCSGYSVDSTPLLLLVSGRFEAWMLNYLMACSHLPSGWCWLFTGHAAFSPRGTLSHLLFLGLQKPHTRHVVGFLPNKHLLRNKPGTSWALLIT